MAISTASPSLSPAPQTPQSTEGAPGPVSPSAMQTVDLPPPVDGLSGGSDSKANSAAPAASQPKRKPSRRASTAERRATHNAVERARRETLNSRFLVSIFFVSASYPCMGKFLVTRLSILHRSFVGGFCRLSLFSPCWMAGARCIRSTADEGCHLIPTTARESATGT